MWHYTCIKSMQINASEQKHQKGITLVYLISFLSFLAYFY